MALIGTDPQAPDVSILQAQLRRDLQIQMNMSFRKLKNDFTDIFTRIWDNQDALTPQQVMDAFGTDAASLFTMAEATQNYLNAIVTDTIHLVPPYHYTIYQDGTVRIGDKI